MAVVRNWIGTRTRTTNQRKRGCCYQNKGQLICEFLNVHLCACQQRQSDSGKNIAASNKLFLINQSHHRSTGVEELEKQISNKTTTKPTQQSHQTNQTTNKQHKTIACGTLFSSLWKDHQNEHHERCRSGNHPPSVSAAHTCSNLHCQRQLWVPTSGRVPRRHGQRYMAGDAQHPRGCLEQLQQCNNRRTRHRIQKLWPHTVVCQQ